MQLHQIERLSADQAIARRAELLQALCRAEEDTRAYQPYWDLVWELALVQSRIVEVTNAPKH